MLLLVTKVVLNADNVSIFKKYDEAKASMSLQLVIIY